MRGGCGSPVHTIQHELLKRGGLKAPPIMAEQQHKDLPVTVLPRPSQGKGAPWHLLRLPLRSPGMRALRRISGDKHLIARSHRQAHVQLIGGLEVRDSTDARMSWGTDVDRELPIGRMETRAGDPPPTGDFMIFRPGLG